MDADILRYLRCPVCAGPLGTVARGGAVCCPQGHSFDLARQGYLNLTTGRAAHTGDTAGMIAARGEFLAAGHYRFIGDALAAAAAAAYTGNLIVDVGAGTGEHLAAVLDAVPAARGLALDAAKPAVRRAARAHERAAAVLADAWRELPLRDGAAGVLLNVFAPRNGPQFHRVLAPGGVLLTVTPAAEHLGELVAALGLLRVDPAKPERLAASLTEWFEPASDERLTRELLLDHRQVGTLVAMGPSAWHAQPDELAARLTVLPEPVRVTASVRLALYTRR